MRLFIIIFMLFMPLLSYAKVETITKTEKVLVPANQSVEQVKQYTSERLAREAAEEAGVAIYASTKLVDGKITKDEIKTQTSAIAKKETKLISQETIKGQTYITVSVTATVDSKELDAFLRQLMQNEALKKELEEERKERLAIEKKLEKATKEEYNKILSKQAEAIAKTQAARQKQLEKEAAYARQQFMETQRRQKQEELKAIEELEKIKKEYLAQDTAYQKQIALEKDAEVKAEMEYKALLAEMAQNALINDKTFDTTRGGDTIEMIVADAAAVRVKYAALIREYDSIIDTNNKRLKELQKKQIDIVKAQEFKEEKPEKGDWESGDEFAAREQAYKKRKQAFEDNKKKQIEKLTKTDNERLQEQLKKQIDAVKAQEFKEEMPEKGIWETGDEYAAKEQAYKKRKQAFEDNKKKQIEKLIQTYNNKVVANTKQDKLSLLNAATPFYKRLKRYSIGSYSSSETTKSVISFGERDVDNARLPITIAYKRKKYHFTYQFKNVQEFRSMYETRSSFIAVPIFAVEPKGETGAKEYLKGFEVIHLGNSKKQFFSVDVNNDIFPEILEYEDLRDELNGTKAKREKERLEKERIEKKKKLAEEKRLREQEEALKNAAKENTSDINVYRNSYRTGYNLYGFGLGGSFDLDSFIGDFTTQYHYRFNRWIGIYTNLGVMVSVNGLSDSQSNSYNDDNYYGSSYYPYYDNSYSSREVDSSVFFGLGLDFYLTDSLLVFGDVSAGYFYDSYSDNSFGAIIKGGVALQSKNMRPIGFKLSVYVEKIISNTISGKSPFFGVGIHF